MVRLVLALHLIAWKTGASLLTWSPSVVIAITFDSHLKTALTWIWSIVFTANFIRLYKEEPKEILTSPLLIVGLLFFVVLNFVKH